MKIRQLIVNEDPEDETHLYTILTESDRIFVGGIVDCVFRWIEIPQPTEGNTTYFGNSPFVQY